MGSAILNALGWAAPTPRTAPRITPELIRQSNEAIDRMRRGHAAANETVYEATAEPAPQARDLILGTSSGVGVDLAEKATRDQAQRLFEASQLGPHG